LEQLFRIRNTPGDLPGALDGVEAFCRGRGLAMETALEVRLVAEEVLTNIVKYAHAGIVEDAITLKLCASADSVRLEFRDEGVPFNPLTSAVSGVQDSRIGGLGLPLIQALVDDATYVREGRANTLVLIKHIGSTV
jgi:sigma-B regulation protein RsbU (phosphoserine phosphatase)